MNCNGCGKEGAKLQCPTCVKLGGEELLSKSFFCSQQCFKDSWATHKAIHPQKKSGEEPNLFPDFNYTGTLRAWPYGPKRTVPSHIKKPDYADTGYPTSEMKERSSHVIKVLNDEEIEKMRTVCRIGREVLDEAAKAIAVGVTTDEIDRVVHEATIERDSYPSPLNYKYFPNSCCTSVNEVICHGIPDTRPLKNGDIVNIDVSVYHQGYHSDLNETYLVGEVDEKGKKLVNVTRECLEKAIEFVRPGRLYRDVGDVIQKHAQANGFSVVKTYCGHGVHKLFHCAPSIPHYSKNKAIGTMKAGHCFTIEPMINEGTWHDELWPDNWTAATKDGKRSAQFEHTMLVTDTGVEVLTARKA